MTHARLDATPHAALARLDGQAVEWRVTAGLTPYEDAVAAMEARVEKIARGDAAELVWLVEHPPLYTAGTSAGLVRDDATRLPSPLWGVVGGGGLRRILDEEKLADIEQRREPPSLTLPHKGEGDSAASPSMDTLPFPLHATGRGGQVTYHGPGQRVAYVMLDLNKRRPDVRAFVAGLERWIIDTLATFDVAGERREDRVGVWVRRPDKPAGIDGSLGQEQVAEDKIAAIGIRVRRWVTFHGISLNVAPDLAHYVAITPCGISASHLGVTSFRDLGRLETLPDVDAALAVAFLPIFGPVIRL